MIFLIDEDVPIEVARALREAGYNLRLVAEELGKETSDQAIWAKAIQAKAIVITCNRQDFLALARDNPQTGLIILNRKRTRIAECNRALALITRAGEMGLRNNINFA